MEIIVWWAVWILRHSLGTRCRYDSQDTGSQYTMLHGLQVITQHITKTCIRMSLSVSSSGFWGAAKKAAL